MMKGIDPRPAAVGNHFNTTAGSPTLLATANLADLTIILITPPGIATDARPFVVSNGEYCRQMIEYVPGLSQIDSILDS